MASGQRSTGGSERTAVHGSAPAGGRGNPDLRQRRLCCDPIGSTTRLWGLGCAVRAASGGESRGPKPGRHHPTLASAASGPAAAWSFRIGSTGPGPERRLAAGTLSMALVVETADRSAVHGGIPAAAGDGPQRSDRGDGLPWLCRQAGRLPPGRGSVRGRAQLSSAASGGCR